MPLNAESPSPLSWFSHLPIINRRNFRHLNRHQTLFIGFQMQIYRILSVGWKRNGNSVDKVKFRLICGRNVWPKSSDTPCQIELQKNFSSWNFVFWLKPSGLFIETTQFLHSKSFRSVSSNARPNKKGIFTVEMAQNVSRLFPSRKDHPRCLRANIKNSFSNATSMLWCRKYPILFLVFTRKNNFSLFILAKSTAVESTFFLSFLARPTWAVTRMLCIINFHINQPYHPDDDGDC